MKVVLFCGGMGLRLREFGEATPKPMVPIGPRPIVWHLLKYYAHYGHKDFILCLGWQGHAIKDYFLNYNECVSNDFVLREGDRVQLLRSDISDWTITFVDTGLTSNIAQRLNSVRPHLAARVEPDLIFTHRRDDAHQDHRLVGELTWNAFRNHLIWEYEIPKYEGDLGQPNTFVALDEATCRRKVQLLGDSFPSQQGKSWFSADAFWALLRLRGLECNAPSRFAEGFYVRKTLV